MVEVNRERLAFITQALTTVLRAIDSERRFVGEPTDDQLKSMQQWLEARRDQLDNFVKNEAGRCPTCGHRAG
jgi:hypothetical protein